MKFLLLYDVIVLYPRRDAPTSNYLYCARDRCGLRRDVRAQHQSIALSWVKKRYYVILFILVYIIKSFLETLSNQLYSAT